MPTLAASQNQIGESNKQQLIHQVNQWILPNDNPPSAPLLESLISKLQLDRDSSSPSALGQFLKEQYPDLKDEALARIFESAYDKTFKEARAFLGICFWAPYDKEKWKDGKSTPSWAEDLENFLKHFSPVLPLEKSTTNPLEHAHSQARSILEEFVYNSLRAPEIEKGTLPQVSLKYRLIYCLQNLLVTYPILTYGISFLQVALSPLKYIGKTFLSFYKLLTLDKKILKNTLIFLGACGGNLVGGLFGPQIFGFLLGLVGTVIAPGVGSALGAILGIALGAFCGRWLAKGLSALWVISNSERRALAVSQTNPIKYGLQSFLSPEMQTSSSAARLLKQLQQLRETKNKKSLPLGREVCNTMIGVMVETAPKCREISPGSLVGGLVVEAVGRLQPSAPAVFLPGVGLGIGGKLWAHLNVEKGVCEVTSREAAELRLCRKAH